MTLDRGTVVLVELPAGDRVVIVVTRRAVARICRAFAQLKVGDAPFDVRRIGQDIRIDVEV